MLSQYSMLHRRNMLRMHRIYIHICILIKLQQQSVACVNADGKCCTKQRYTAEYTTFHMARCAYALYTTENCVCCWGGGCWVGGGWVCCRWLCIRVVVSDYVHITYIRVYIRYIFKGFPQKYTTGAIGVLYMCESARSRLYTTHAIRAYMKSELFLGRFLEICIYVLRSHIGLKEYIYTFIYTYVIFVTSIFKCIYTLCMLG